MSELLNPLQIAGRLKKQSASIIRVIIKNDIPAHKIGLRAGLYDIDEVKTALDRDEAEKKP
jgi:hypothetical protein